MAGAREQGKPREAETEGARRSSGGVRGGAGGSEARGSGRRARRKAGRSAMLARAGGELGPPQPRVIARVPHPFFLICGKLELAAHVDPPAATAATAPGGFSGCIGGEVSRLLGHSGAGHCAGAVAPYRVGAERIHPRVPGAVVDRPSVTAQP